MPHAVLGTVLPVVRDARNVSIDLERLAEHAGWMTYEELPPPALLLPFPLELDRDGIVDFVLTATSIKFAFTDFATRRRWEVEQDGRVFADADGLHFCLHRALAESVPVLDDAWLREVEADDLRELFRGGTSELQLLDERARILRGVGETLVERYDGRFHNVLAAAAPWLYDGGNGFPEVLVRTSRASKTSPSTAGRRCASGSWRSSRSGSWRLRASGCRSTERTRIT